MFTPKPFYKTILNSADAGAGDEVKVINYTYKTAVITISGTGTAECTIQVSIDKEHWVTAQKADGTNAVYTSSGYFESDHAFHYLRANNTNPGGKNVQVDLACNK